MSDTPEPHPLDDVADEAGRPSQPRRSSADQPLLKAGVIMMIAGFVVLFLSGVATTNAPPNSTIESFSSAVNRLSTVVLLFAFCLILLAYRLPYLKQRVLTREAWTSPSSGFARLQSSGFATLVLFNVVGYVLVCAMFAFLLSIPSLGMPLWIITLSLSYVLCGLLVTVAIWHTDYLRAYAVGVLTVIALTIHSGGGAMMMMPRGGFLPMNASLVLAVGLGVAQLTGLVCAGYVTLVTCLRERRSRKQDV